MGRMASVFACPECGQELDVEGLSPGREVRCPTCSTSVEVPFLRRAGDRARGRRTVRRNPWASKSLRAAIGFAVVALAILAATRMIGGRVRSDRQRVLNELIASAQQAETSGRFDEALREAEGALAQARTFEPAGSERIADLTARRDRVSLLEARQRLSRLEGLDPARAVGEALILDARARRDPALEPLAGAIEASLTASRLRQVEADLTAARLAFASGRDAEALSAAIQLHDHANNLTGPAGKRFLEEARSILEGAVGRSGVALPLVAGRFVAGSSEAYAATLDRLRVESLRTRGYLPQPRRSPWSSVWDEKAAYALTIQITETQEEFYLQSRNRTTQIDGTVEFTREGQVVWKSRVVGRTRVPLPDLPAYLAGHLATSGKHNPEAERRLHDDAQTQFLEQVTRNLRSLPGR